MTMNDPREPVKGKKVKSFDPEGTGKWVAGTIWEDGTIYIESELVNDPREGGR